MLVFLLAGLAASMACGGQSGGGAAQPSATTSAWPASARVEGVRERLHTEGSGAAARAAFPDLVQTYVDDGHGKQGLYKPEILPFRYYWSPSARVTIAICAVARTVFVCPYYLDHLLTTAEFPQCDVHISYSSPEVVPAPPVGRP